MIINTEYPLPKDEYHQVVYTKKQIVLHHTVSSTVKSTINWFKDDLGKSKVAVAYVIDKDGIIYQLFDPKHWAWHIGYGSTHLHNKQSIGIEIVNEGVVTKKNDMIYWFDGRYKFKGEVVELSEEWRGVKYFAKYTEEQVKATHELLLNILDDFPAINRQFTNTFDYDKKYLDYSGITMHVNLRKDKTDLSPAWNISKTNEIITTGYIEADPTEVTPINIDHIIPISVVAEADSTKVV